MKNHPIYYVSPVGRVAENPFPRQVIPSPPPVVVDDEEEYVVEEILDAQLRSKRLQYLVKRVGYEC